MKECVLDVWGVEGEQNEGDSDHAFKGMVIVVAQDVAFGGIRGFKGVPEEYYNQQPQEKQDCCGR